jgi:hypothetical protein
MLIGVLFITAASVPIEVGLFNPQAFPDAKKVERRMPQGELTARVDRILGRGECSIPGQSKVEYAITVPYAVRVGPSGRVSKIVVKEMGCAPIELLTGQVAQELAKAGDFKPTSNAAEQWYVSEAYYAHGAQDLARRMDDENKIICESPRMATMSHIAKVRICRTAAEWRVFASQRDQYRQDILTGGANKQMDPPPISSTPGMGGRP